MSDRSPGIGTECRIFRRSMLVDPTGADAVLQHSRGCVECAAWAQRLAKFEQRLGQALHQDPRAPAAPPRARRVRPPRLLALAASVVAAAVAALLLMLAVPRASLARDLVQHVAAEPQSFAPAGTAVPAATLASVLSTAGMRFAPGADLVTYASACDFRGHRVPHLVVQTTRGPVTVMVLRDAPAFARMRFDEQGYRGIIVPLAGHGALAVLGLDRTLDAAMLDELAARVRGTLVFTG